MKNLILEFLEKEPLQAFDTQQENLQYSTELSLTVFKDTNKPAIWSPVLATETITKSGGEARDPDKNIAAYALATRTHTNVQLESSDSDAPRRFYLATQTYTETSKEPTDSDR